LVANRRWHVAIGLGGAAKLPSNATPIREQLNAMPDKETLKRLRRDRAQGKSASTQAGEFVREEMEHIREGKHGVRSAKQAIAIGLSKARRAGVDLPPPKKGKYSEKVRHQAQRELRQQGRPHHPSRRRSRAVTRALKRESQRAASHRALSRHARTAARQRSAADRSATARRAARTRRKGK
jgi:hypothetical protein